MHVCVSVPVVCALVCNLHYCSSKQTSSDRGKQGLLSLQFYSFFSCGGRKQAVVGAPLSLSTIKKKKKGLFRWVVSFRWGLCRTLPSASSSFTPANFMSSFTTSQHPSTDIVTMLPLAKSKSHRPRLSTALK